MAAKQPTIAAPMYPDWSFAYSPLSQNPVLGVLETMKAVAHLCPASPPAAGQSTAIRVFCRFSAGRAVLAYQAHDGDEGDATLAHVNQPKCRIENAGRSHSTYLRATRMDSMVKVIEREDIVFALASNTLLSPLSGAMPPELVVASTSASVPVFARTGFWLLGWSSL